MPLFEFDGGGVDFAFRVQSGSISFAESGVTFTVSVTSPSGPSNNILWYNPTGTLNGNTGFMSFRGSGDSTDQVTLTAFDAGNGAGAFSGKSGDPITLNVLTVAGTMQAVFVSDSGTFKSTLTTGGTIQAVGRYTEIRFTTSGQFSIGNIETNINCFLEGTRMTTPSGEVAIETLQAGDRLTTADGGSTTVKWVAKQQMHPMFQQPEEINPICIKAGALDAGVPARDLFVTGDHALLIDGMLINAGALVNGQTIFQVARMPVEGFFYYHVETEQHEVVLAEGTAAESFVDYQGRDAFDNCASHPNPQAVICEMPLPRISSGRMVPETVTAQIAARALAVLPPLAG